MRTHQWLTLALFLVPQPGIGAVMDARRIERTAQEFIQKEMRASPGQTAQAEAQRLDPRLRLLACERMHAFLPPGAQLTGTVHVGVRCVEAASWLVYVAVKVAVNDTVLMATRPLARGQVLAPQHFAAARRDVGALPPGYVSDATVASGKRLLQPVAAGTVLTQSMLEAPLLVRRGESVTIVARASGIEVRAAGTALADAAEGQVVDVRNVSSGRALRAVVVAPGVVEARP